MIRFEIPGECVPKGRPRFRTVGAFVQTYNTKETIYYENLVKVCFKDTLFEGFMNKEQIGMNITIYKEIPKSASKKKVISMLNGDIRPTTKPDADNCAKSICDGLNKIAYSDDSQICELTIKKYYSEKSRTVVELYEVCNSEQSNM